MSLFEEKNTPKVKVLIVDDGPMNRKLTSKAFSKEGYEVDTANDGIEGFEKYIKGDYNIIIMDIEMPRKNGIELTREIREYEKKNNRCFTPIIAATTKPESFKIVCLEAGMQDFFHKPFPLGSLLSKSNKNIDNINPILFFFEREQ